MEVACKSTDPRGGVTDNIALTKTFIAATEGQPPATFTLECVCVCGWSWGQGAGDGEGTCGHGLGSVLYPRWSVKKVRRSGLQISGKHPGPWHFSPFLDRIPVTVTASPSFWVMTGLSLSCAPRGVFPLIFKPARKESL